MLLGGANQQLLQQSALQQANQLQLLQQQVNATGAGNVLLQGLPGNVIQTLQKQLSQQQQQQQQGGTGMMQQYTGKLSSGGYLSQEKAMQMAQQSDRYGREGRESRFDSHVDSRSGRSGGGRDAGSRRTGYDDRRGSEERRGGGGSSSKRTRDNVSSRRDMDSGSRRGKDYQRPEPKSTPKGGMRDSGPSQRNQPRRDRSPPPKRDRSPVKTAQPHRTGGGGGRAASPSPPRKVNNVVVEYGVKLSPFKYGTLERDYVDVARRYQDLLIPLDFSKLLCHWTQVQETGFGTYGCSLVPLDKAVQVDTVVPTHKEKDKTKEKDSDSAGTKNSKKQELKEGEVVYNAKVVPCLGLDVKSIKLVKDGPRNNGEHLLNCLKFLVGKVERHGERSQIQCIGGKYDPKLDGEDPEKDDKVLVNTCIRCLKDTLNIDLSKNTLWVKFVEINYMRPLPNDKGHYRETTVVYLVDVSQCLPSEQEWPALWKSHVELKKTAREHEKAKYAAREAAEKKHKEDEKRRSSERVDSFTVIKTEKSKPSESKEEEDVVANGNKEDKPADTSQQDIENAEQNANQKQDDQETKQEEQNEDGDEEMVDVETAQGGGKNEQKQTEAKEKDEKDDKADEKGEAKKKVEEYPLPESPQLLVQTLVNTDEKWKVMPISLNGLLDYDETDKEEGTFELSLFAEAFHEMLMRDYGEKILKTLYKEQRKTIVNREKRKAAEAAAKLEAQKKKEEEAAAKAKKEQEDKVKKETKQENGKEEEDNNQGEEEQLEPETKKLKLDENEEDAGRQQEDDDGGEMELEMKEEVEDEIMLEETDAEQKEDETEDMQVEGDTSKKEEAKEEDKDRKDKDNDKKPEQKEERQKVREVDEKLLWAFRYFDQTGAGYFKVEDLRRLVHCLGHCLSSKIVKDLVLNVAEAKGRHKYERVYYRDLTDKVYYKDS
eukprot:TRINITY_DN1870_c1_g1_i2.p1 TRINITY_DN1870_c1_g1~~TRINITY_DN1870_c1_g1_i2.p1  ORF type:complete len:1059 (+),score=244.46 TRINITY_DN1870_c1_g1_i2:368-3178(+)